MNVGLRHRIEGVVFEGGRRKAEGGRRSVRLTTNESRRSSETGGEIMNHCFRAATLLLMLACGGTLAQDYPQRPVRMVIGLPAGGSTDVMARIDRKSVV